MKDLMRKLRNKKLRMIRVNRKEVAIVSTEKIVVG